MSVVGAVFDMDGLLIDTERLQQDAYRATRAGAGLPPDDELFFSLIGLNAKAGHARLVTGLADIVEVESFLAEWQARFTATLADGIPVKRHVRAVLEALANRGIPMAVATSTHADVAHAHLSRAGLRPFFRVLVGGNQVANGKPAPDIYLRAAAALDLEPARCAAFEDSANGVRAAVAAGLVTIQIPDLVHPSPELLALGHRVAPDLAHAMRLVGLLPEPELIPSL
jgi:HAD superfamily hydrolase (TIGR01509 family)